MKFLTTIAFAFLFAWTMTQNVSGQIFGKEKSEKPSADLIPRTAFLGASAFPTEIASHPLLKAYPHEVVSAWGKKEFGFDPMLIKQVTWVLSAPDDIAQKPLSWAIVFHFEKMQGLAGSMIDKLEKKEVAGKTVFSSGNDWEPSFMIADEATIIFGMESYFEEMLTTTGGRVGKLFKEGTATGQAFLAMDMESATPIIDEILKDADRLELAPPIERLKLIPDLLTSMEAAIETKSRVGATIILHAKSESSAEELNEILVDAMEYGRISLIKQLTSQLDLEDPVQVATIEYSNRVYEKFEKQLTPVVDGKDLTITANEETLALPIIASMIGSAYRVQLAPPEIRMTPEIRLRQTTLASLNYESAYQRFPARVVKDEDGNVLFSGRMSMLPFIEQNNLYNQLKKDEPWNSKHNLQFSEMAIPAFGVNKDGKSTVRFPVFPDSIWDEKNDGVGFGQVTDGSSNTIFAIHAPDNAAISWADPSPWTISENNPMQDIFGGRDEVVVAMMDGSTRTLKRKNMTNAKLKAMLTISGGETVE